MLKPERGVCTLRLELHSSDDPPYTAYSTVDCGASLFFSRGQPASQAQINDMKTKMSPASAILSGAADNGSIQLHLQQAVADAPDKCGVTSLKLTPFGAGTMAASWEEGPDASCQGGKVLMHRVPQ